MTPEQERFREFIRTVGRGERRAKSLSFADAREALGLILDGRADAEQRGAFLLACRIRGEEPEEMAGFVAAMRERCAPLAGAGAERAVSVGHPYDGREDTFIMGAGAALIAAAAGVRTVLHGAGRVPAKHAAGAGGVLEALGIPAHLGPAEATAFLSTHGFVHVDTRQFMPAWNGVLEVREKIGLRLPFSSAEKLLDFSNCGNLIAGIAHGPYLEKMSGAMQRLNVRRGLVVQGLEGSCDLSPQHATRVAEIDGGQVRESSVDPRALGLDPQLDVRAIGADPHRCALLTRDALNRVDSDEARAAAEALCLNAAVILWRAEAARDVADGVVKARALVASGAAAEILAKASRG